MSQATIAWIGTGVMGRSMAGHLLAAGHPVILYSRTRERAEALLAQGATWANSPREAAEQASIVCSMVGYPADVESVHLGSHGTMAATNTPALLVPRDRPRQEQLIRARALQAHGAVDVLPADALTGDFDPAPGGTPIILGYTPLNLEGLPAFGPSRCLTIGSERQLLVDATPEQAASGSLETSSILLQLPFSSSPDVLVVATLRDPCGETAQAALPVILPR
jgi:hypothetical protein